MEQIYLVFYPTLPKRQFNLHHLFVSCKKAVILAYCSCHGQAYFINGSIFFVYCAWYITLFLFVYYVITTVQLHRLINGTKHCDTILCTILAGIISCSS